MFCEVALWKENQQLLIFYYEFILIEFYCIVAVIEL